MATKTDAPPLADGTTPRPDATVTGGAEVRQPREGLSLLVVGDGVLATEALPTHGRAVIGRAVDADVRIDDPSISRTHAVLHLDDPLRIEDAGSANGTWVRDERIAPGLAVPILLNQAVRLGSVTIIVQRRAQQLRTRRRRSHDYIENRIEEECARGLRRETTFLLVHVVLADRAADIEGACDALGGCLREGDLVATYGPGEIELLVLDADPAHGGQVLSRVEAVLAGRGLSARIGAAWYPRDSRDASALAGRARDRAHGAVIAEVEPADIVIGDERMRALHELVSRVAAADISVLLQGETGVGKEIIAEQIHKRSARAGKPFLRLNCAALSETLLESELFGHERGAFTGATATKPGLLEVAEGGVLFLDEIGEIQPSIQAKLLRVLDERKVMRVGGLTPRPIDVRIVSATNRDLEAEVQRGAFRLDLLYRLNAMSIIIPPLRERAAEIEPLARRFLARMAATWGRPAPRLTLAATAALQEYSWPGNVRELRNVIERAMVLATGDVIDLADLPIERMRATFQAARMTQPLAVVPPARSSEPDLDGDAAAALEPDERQRILAALESCAGNQTHAARLLGISRRTLINKIEKFAVPRPRKR